MKDVVSIFIESVAVVSTRFVCVYCVSIYVGKSQSQLVQTEKMQLRPLSMLVYFDPCFPLISMTSHQTSNLVTVPIFKNLCYIIFVSHSQ